MKSAWKMAPFLQSGGTYIEDVLRLRSLKTLNGAQILLRLSGSEIPETPDKHQSSAIHIRNEFDVFRCLLWLL